MEETSLLLSQFNVLNYNKFSTFRRIIGFIFIFIINFYISNFIINIINQTLLYILFLYKFVGLQF